MEGLEVGDRLNILTFDPETFDSTYTSREERSLSPLIRTTSTNLRRQETD